MFSNIYPRLGDPPSRGFVIASRPVAVARFRGTVLLTNGHSAKNNTGPDGSHVYVGLYRPRPRPLGSKRRGCLSNVLRVSSTRSIGESDNICNSGLLSSLSIVEGRSVLVPVARSNPRASGRPNPRRRIVSHVLTIIALPVGPCHRLAILTLSN